LTRFSGPDSRTSARALVLTLTCLVSACGSNSASDGSGNASSGESGGAGNPNNAQGGVSNPGGASANGGAAVTDAGGASGAGGTTNGAGGSTTGGSATNGGASGGAAGAAHGGATGNAGAGGGVTGPAVAFPGAVGVGRNATGGRGGTVYHVTTLADSGTGSFRDAVSQGPRIIVFDVGGYIDIKTPISAKSNLTIAGQTAPGDGVGIMGGEVSFSGAKNVIARYIRFRQGDLDPDSSKSGINLLDTDAMIFDHVSIEFAQWNNIDAVGASNITVQYSISADPIGQQFAAHTETGPYTWYRDLFANAHNRCPLAKANTQYVDNVVYDFQAGYTAGNSAGQFSHDVINNYFITGPATTSANNAFYQVNAQLMFASGNLLDKTADGTLNGVALDVPGAATKLTSPFSPDTAAIPTTGAANAYAVVVAQAGASLHRDEVDTQVIADLKSLGKTGALWTHQTATGLSNSGYGTLQGGTAPADTDGDGMPDTWETKYGLNPKDATDANGDFDHTGYTNIEKYVNGLADGSYPD
jgi:hypothetical protein